TPDRFREWLARDAGLLDESAGRKWRSLSDTAITAQLLYGARDDYSLLRRGVDFYPEGALIWFEADTLIRQLSHGAKSLDDFCHLFFGDAASSKHTGPLVSPYTRENLIAALQAVQPYDWDKFITQRVDATGSRTPRAGIANAGWKLAFRD